MVPPMLGEPQLPPCIFDETDKAVQVSTTSRPHQLRQKLFAGPKFTYQGIVSAAQWFPPFRKGILSRRAF